MARRPLTGFQIGARIAFVIVFGLLAFGSWNVFWILDSQSHSASDTLRPFLLAVGPVWIVAIWAARIVTRAR